MGLKKLFPPSSRTAGSYAPVDPEKSPEDPSDDAPCVSVKETLKTEKVEELKPELIVKMTIDEFALAFLGKAQQEFKKKVSIDQSEDGTKPAFCGTTEKRRRKREALAILCRHLDREIMLLKRRHQYLTKDLDELTETQKFDRFFIQLAVDIFYVYEHQLQKYLTKKVNSYSKLAGNQGKSTDEIKRIILQSIADLAAKLCFSKFCEGKFKNLSKDEILFKTLTHFDSTTMTLIKRESGQRSQVKVKDVHVNVKNKDKVKGSEEKEKKIEIETDDTTSKNDLKVKVKDDHKRRGHGHEHGNENASLKFFVDTSPAFYCTSSGSLLVQSKNLKKLLKGNTEPSDIALRLRKPFKIEWDQMQRGCGEKELKTIDHLIDGREEDMKKFMWIDRNGIVMRIYEDWLIEVDKLNQENADEEEKRNQLKEAFIQLDQDIDHTQDVIREMEEKLR